MECYDRPDLWDFAFSDETDFEADFIQQMASRWLNTNRPAVLEIGCGGGRQTVNLAMRGLPVTAFDLNPTCVRETLRRLKRRRLAANVFTADMLDFQTSETFDLAHCLVNTFRHLTDEQSARCHLQAVARALRPGGLYLLGFHLLPPDAAEEDCELDTATGKKIRHGHCAGTAILSQDSPRDSAVQPESNPAHRSDPAAQRSSAADLSSRSVSQPAAGCSRI